MESWEQSYFPSTHLPILPLGLKSKGTFVVNKIKIKEKDELDIRSDSGTVNINVAKFFCLFSYMKQKT